MMGQLITKYHLLLFIATCGLLLSYVRKQGRKSTDSFQDYFSIPQPIVEDSAEICLVYDRPPRTGSSTSGRAFQECWDDLHFNIVNKDRLESDEETVKILVNSGPFVAATSFHFRVTEDDIIDLTSKCKHLFYVTSTRSIRERIISTALGAIEKTNFTLTENVTMAEDQLPAAMVDASRRSLGLERKLEEYPYWETNERITPDYVIRYENFTHDLGAILKAFGCTESFESVNIHILSDVKSDIHVEAADADTAETANTRLKNLQLNLSRNDDRHTEMSKLAEVVNQSGLSKAARLAHLRRSRLMQ